MGRYCMRSTIELIKPLFSIAPEKFFQRPELEKETWPQVFVNVLPFIIISIIGFSVVVVVFKSIEFELLAVSIALLALSYMILYLLIAIPLKILGHSFFRSYQAFMYGSIPFLVAFWMPFFGVISLVLSFFAIYWGLVTLHRMNRLVAIASLVAPLIFVILWQQFPIWLSDMMTAVLNLENLHTGQYTDAAHNFSLNLPQDTLVMHEENDTLFSFVWEEEGNASGKSVYRLLMLEDVIVIHSPDEIFSDLKDSCAEKETCELISEGRTQFLGYDAFEFVARDAEDGSFLRSKWRVFCVENSQCFILSCILYEEDYAQGIAGCDAVASTFSYGGLAAE